MGRLIDIEVLKGCAIIRPTSHETIEHIKQCGDDVLNHNDIPTYNKGGWIPCSERLPSREEYQKCNGQFIVSDGNRTYATYFDIYDTLKFGEPTMDKFKIDKCVIAWMPLPAPFEQEKKQ